MFGPHIRGRRRCLNQAKKVEVCDLVAHGATVEEAADVINVSLRTIQREMKLDEDFHHEVQVSLGHAPDPLKLMQQAARAHWRAAAWLLERTNPEQYARRPKSSASPEQFEAGLQFALEAALEAVLPEQRTAVHQHVQAACEQAFKCVFPNYGPWGKPKNPKLPPTPLADEQGRLEHFRNPANHVYEKEDPRYQPPASKNTPAAQPQAAPAPQPNVASPLQPRTLPGGRTPSPTAVAPPNTTPPAPAGRRHVARDASPWNDRPHHPKPQRGDVASTVPQARIENLPARSIRSLASRTVARVHRILSPKTSFATKSNAGENRALDG